MQTEGDHLPAEAIRTLRKAGLHPPKTLTLAITEGCNLRCAHCWVDAALSPLTGHVATPVLRRLMEEFAAMGGEKICFTGGEPLCHPDWQDILGHARTLGFAGVSLQTNSMLIGEAEVAALCRFDFPGLSVQISLDGGAAPSHDRVRGAGAFQGAMVGLERLVKSGLGPRITLFFTEMQHNLEELPAVLELAAGLGLSAVVSGALVLCGRASTGSSLAPADPDQYASLLQRYDTDPRFRQLYEELGTTAALAWRKVNAGPATGCTFAQNPYLTPRGVLYPCVLCHADEFAVSKVFEKGLASALIEGTPLWSSLARISRSRAAKNPACRKCLELETCAGGCMGRAWGSCGNLLAVDDRCEVRKTVYRLKNSDPSPNR
jgi:radical SAM protein with 4Fe4S-binding SPASM domain